MVVIMICYKLIVFSIIQLAVGELFLLLMQLLATHIFLCNAIAL